MITWQQYGLSLLISYVSVFNASAINVSSVKFFIVYKISLSVFTTNLSIVHLLIIVVFLVIFFIIMASAVTILSVNVHVAIASVANAFKAIDVLAINVLAFMPVGLIEGGASSWLSLVKSVRHGGRRA